ncbi:MAG: DUF2812 domain-containing protein [Anaerolineales bacterium]|nr:DUF2812 domain-containing protein [Anaerolineales bacterium]
MTTMKQFHWFWAWDDEKEEAWLRQMSQKGWHFLTVAAPGSYTFEQGEPADYVYRLDYFINRKEMASYLQLFQDAGWDYMGEMGGWQYFRQEAIKGEAPEIYTDNASKAQKYQRLILFLVILFPIYFSTTTLVTRDATNGFIQVVGILMAVLMLVYIYAMVRLLHRITQLRKKI